jgi:hypothetical protein
VNMKERMLMTRMKYSVLKEKMKENERRWSKGNPPSAHELFPVKTNTSYHQLLFLCEEWINCCCCLIRLSVRACARESLRSSD